MGGYKHDVETFKLAVEHINKLKPDFVVICGDLINTTEDDQAFADFNTVKAGFEMPCYCVAGNHDVGNSPTVELLERYRALVGKDYYAFEHKGYVFVMVNTQLWKAPVEGESARHDAWFAKTLQAASEKGAPVFVVGHYPLYLAEPDEPEEYFNLPVTKRKELLALFEQHGVVAVLSGHVHRNIVNSYRGIQFVSSDTTSRNFDGAPMGFRVWRVGKTRPYAHQFVTVEGASPPAPANDS
jgi:3',5'-cyclic AMP phosphodiesterase CpdA